MGSYLSFYKDLDKDRASQANRAVPEGQAWLGDGAEPLIPGPRNTEKLSQTDSMNCSWLEDARGLLQEFCYHLEA